MNTVGARLDFYIRSKGYNNLAAFGEEHSFVYGTIVQILKRRQIGMKILDKFSQLWPELNMNWLLYGRGPMEIDYSLPGWITEVAMAMAIQLKKDKSLREKALIFLTENAPKG